MGATSGSEVAWVIIVEASPVATLGWRVVFSERSGWVGTPLVVPTCEDVLRSGMAHPSAGRSSSERASEQVPVVVLDPSCDCVSTEFHARDCVRRLSVAGFAVLVRAGQTDRHLARVAIAAGALGAIDRAASTETVREAVRRLAGGEEWTDPVVGITPAQARASVPVLAGSELTALALYGGGMTLESVARKMGVRAGTVRTYLERARRKYDGCRRPIVSRADYTLRAIEDGYLALR